MRIRSALLLVSIVVTLSGLAQQHRLQGTVLESRSDQFLEFATVVLLSPVDSSLVTGTTTDDQGHFEVLAPSGRYILKVEFIGFRPLFLDDLSLDSDLTLDPIRLEPDAQLLDAVDVTAERSSIEFKLDKRVFNVGKDITSKGGSATDVLSNVPSVSVDAAGEVSLRGNTGVRILINGKPSVLTENGGLETIPSDNIEKVEVITNPSSKYNAEGTAGIINIILKKNKQGGFSTAITATAGIPDDQSLNLNLNYKTDVFNVFSNFRYGIREFLGYSEFLRRSYNGEELVSMLDQRTDVTRQRSVLNIYIGGDYYIDPNNTLTLSFYHRNNVSKSFSDYIYRQLDADMSTDTIITAYESYREPQRSSQIELNHVMDFEKEGQQLTFNLQYDFWNDDDNEFLTQELTFPEQSPLLELRSRDVESSKDFIFQSDFTLPLRKDEKLEFGTQGEIRQIDSDYEVIQSDVLIDSLDNYLDYYEDIIGVYTQYGNSRNKLQYQLGLRVEYAYTRSDDTKEQFITDKRYTRLFPTAHLTYRFTESSNVQLSYSRRIRRPRFWQLNPFGGISDTRNIRIGNPDLNPMYTNSFELAFLKRGEKITFNPSIYHQYTTDLFQMAVNRNAEGVLIAQSINAGTEELLGVELISTYSPKQWLRLTHEVNFFAFRQEGLFDVEGKSWTSNLMSVVRAKKFSAQLGLRYRAPRKTGQIERYGQYWVDLGASQDLWNDQVTIAFNFRNIMDSRTNPELVIGDDYTLDRVFVWSGRRAMITATYRFNRKKSDRDRLPD
ncbi:MAG: TonB-dependent receptor [Flavobacteriales bacterium]|nr:TonB-dependent receptor [Flavobacteriales bacterium]